MAETGGLLQVSGWPGLQNETKQNQKGLTTEYFSTCLTKLKVEITCQEVNHSSPKADARILKIHSHLSLMSHIVKSQHAMAFISFDRTGSCQQPSELLALPESELKRFAADRRE